MLNFTRNCFEKVLVMVNGEANSVLIARQHITSNGDVICKALGTIDNIRNISIIKGMDFYDDYHNVQVIASLNDGNLSYNSTTNLVTLTSGYVAPISGEHLVIYAFRTGGDLDYSGLFDDSSIGLVSIDYVGGDILRIGQLNCNGYTFKEIDASNIYDAATNILNSTNIEDNQNVYFGNHNAVQFESGIFASNSIKRFVFPESNINYTIPANCFAGNTSLIEVVIPDCVTEIKAGAFSGCTNLKYVYIGSNLTTIGDKAFNKCVNLEYFYIGSNNTKYLSFYGCLLERDSVHGYFKLVFANHNWWDTQYSEGVDRIRDMYLSAGGWSGMPDAPQILSYSDIYSTGQSTGQSGGIKVQPGMSVILDASESGLSPDGRYNLLNGGSFRGLLVTESNKTQVINAVGSDMADDLYAMPIYYFITEILDDACSGDTLITTVDLTRYKSLLNIHKNAFNGCTGISVFNLPAAPNPTTLSYPIGIGSMRRNSIIGISAFAGCTHISELIVNQKFDFGDKAFFGCTLLDTIQFNDDIASIGIQTFSNTPNLGSITSTWNGASENGYAIQSGTHCIFQSRDNYKHIMVGCKNTLLSQVSMECSGVHDYAFYGCTTYKMSAQDLTKFSQGHGWTRHIGNYAFYGCTSLTDYLTQNINNNTLMIKSETIGNYAFYGCAGITALNLDSLSALTVGTKAFANTGVKTLTISAKVEGLANDAFEGCILQNVTAVESYSSICRESSTNVQNSVLKKLTNNEVNLIKSGDGKDILNVEYNHNMHTHNEEVADISNNAFNGINVNTTGNYNIYIASTVKNVGKEIFKESKIDGSVTGGNSVTTLNIQRITADYNSIVNELNETTQKFSTALLYLLGAKYFKKMIEDTYNHRMSYHYYELSLNSAGDELSVIERNNGGNDINFVKIGYDSDNNIGIRIDGALLPGYDNEDNASHVSMLPERVIVTLMYKGQSLTPTDIAHYLDSELLAHYTNQTAWCGYNIPHDLVYHQHETDMEFDTLSPGAFADCKWVSNIIIGRRISPNANGIFKGCTKLTNFRSEAKIKYNVTDTDAYCSAFNGVIGPSVFEGCTSLVNLNNGSNNELGYPRPVIIGNNAFKDTSFNDSSILVHANEFNDGCFQNTPLTTINLHSACNISPKAFLGCPITQAKADSTCGYYFTGYGNCIVDKNYKVVIGAPNFDPNTRLDDVFCKGVGDFSFYKRTYTNFNVDVLLEEFNVGESAFAESNIITFESIAYDSEIGKSAFEKCINLTTVTLANNVILGESAFSGCTALININLPENITIPKNAFKNCSLLPSVTLSNYTIGANAFENCIQFTSLLLEYVSNSTATINPSAFIKCPISNVSIYGEGSATTVNYTFEPSGIYTLDETKIIVGINNLSKFAKNGTKIIGEHAYNGRGLTGEVVIPASITKIEDYAFANNPGITRVSLPPTIEYIGENAFSGCTLLTQATLPDSCTFIGKGAFSGCPLTYGFNCNAIEDVYHIDRSEDSKEFPPVVSGSTTFKSSLDLSNCKGFGSISNGCFESCGIEIVKLPYTCTFINNNAFKGCNYLTELHIYSTSLTFDNYSFYSCSKLRDIYFHVACSNITVGTDWAYGVGSSVSGNKTIHIPSAMNNFNFYNNQFTVKLVSLGFTVLVDI